MSETTRWLGTTEAAERLGVVPRTLYRMIDEGAIPAKMAAASAAREATRSFVESTAPNRSVALARAEAVAGDTIEGYGRNRSRMVLVAEEADLRRCARVTLRVEYPVPLITLPFVGGRGSGFTAVGRHSEIVDPFRGGLADRSACPPALTP